MWRSRVQTERNEEVVICRIDLLMVEDWALAENSRAGRIDFERGMLRGQVLDRSHVRCKRFFEPYDGSPRVDKLCGALNRAISDKEVLICWRGHVPERFFEIVDNERGMFVRELGDTAEVTL